MADDTRVSAVYAYVKTVGSTDAVQATSVYAYVKVRPEIDDIRATGISSYVKLYKPWPTTYAYRVVDGHDATLNADDDIDPQPAHGFVKVTRREHSDNTQLQDDSLYVEMEYSAVGSVTEYQSILTQFGVLSAIENEVTVMARDHALRWKRYNGTAVRPKMGEDVRWDSYFIRGAKILIKDLELIG